MPRRPEPLLARWPLLYPEVMGTSEQDDDLLGEAERIRKKTIAPLLDTDDIHNVINVKREEYQRWRASQPAQVSDPETVLAQEARFDDTLATFLEGHRDELGEQAVKAALESVKLRRIARDSVLPHRETWPEESWLRIGQLMTRSEVCLAGILEHLTTGEGSRANVETLARLAFETGLAAYYDADENGRDFHPAGRHTGVDTSKGRSRRSRPGQRLR